MNIRYDLICDRYLDKKLNRKYKLKNHRYKHIKNNKIYKHFLYTRYHEITENDELSDQLEQSIIENDKLQKQIKDLINNLLKNKPDINDIDINTTNTKIHDILSKYKYMINNYADLIGKNEVINWEKDITNCINKYLQINLYNELIIFNLYELCLYENEYNFIIIECLRSYCIYYDWFDYCNKKYCYCKLKNKSILIKQRTLKNACISYLS